MEPLPRFEVFPDEAGEWRWRLLGGNGEIVATGESHRDPTDADRACRGVIGIIVGAAGRAPSPVHTEEDIIPIVRRTDGALGYSDDELKGTAKTGPEGGEV